VQVTEIVEKINNGEKVGDVAKSLGMAQSTLSRKLKIEGYTYNQKTKVYEISEEKSNDSSSDVGKSSEKNQNIVKQNSELPLTDDEIKFVKDSYKRRTFFDKNFEVAWEKSKLPSRKPEKKTPYIISQKTFEDFKKFADVLENEYRITQNELVEIALQKLMREWQ
jgi:hypothetical protein